METQNWGRLDWISPDKLDSTERGMNLNNDLKDDTGKAIGTLLLFPSNWNLRWLYWNGD